MTHTSGIGSNAISSTLVDRSQIEKQLKVSSTQISDTSAGQQDIAKLSGAGSVLATAGANTDDVRTERVAALKSAVDAGTYNISSTAVADKLLDSMLE